METYALTPCGQGIYIKYLEFFCREDMSLLPLPPAIYYFIQSFIYMWTHGYFFYTLGYNPVPLYLFCCSSQELFELAPVSL